MQQTIAAAAKAASRTSGVTDDVATSAQKASQVAEEAADAAQELAEKAGLLSRFTAAAGRISGSTRHLLLLPALLKVRKHCQQRYLNLSSPIMISMSSVLNL